jgi:two-component system, LuxR family, sensor kinase FixL
LAPRSLKQLQSRSGARASFRNPTDLGPESDEGDAKYRHAAELAGLIVWTADANGNFLSVSPAFTRITGLEPGPQRRAIHPDDVDQVLAEWKRSTESGEPHTAEFRMRVADGNYRYFCAKSAPRRDSSGAIIGWYGFTEDIHERKLAEFAHDEIEERYRLAVRATDDALYDLDIDRWEIRWRDTESEFFGYRGQKEASPLSWWEEKLHPDDHDWVIDGFRQILRSDRDRWAIDYRFRKADGSYADVHDQGVLIRDSGGRARRAVGAMTDVTRQKKAENELRRMESELIHVSRLNAMGTMASTLAHELNQPLTAANNFISGARRLAGQIETPLAGELLAALEAAGASAVRAGEIVRRLRELVSRGRASAKAEHLPKLIKEASVLALVDATLQGVNHRVELDEEAKWVWADRIQIQQVLINLARNAIEAMQHCPVRELLISTHRLDRKTVEVRIADTGSGLAASDPEQLFSQFVSSKSGGMGLGLPISRTIVEAHGGRIRAERRPEGGAVFAFTLPASTSDAKVSKS